MKAPAVGLVRVGGGNIDTTNPNTEHAVQVAMDTQSDSWGWSEGNKTPHHLRKMKDYRGLTAFGFEDMKDANDCTMMVHRERDVVHFSMTQVCEDAEPAKLAHDRTFSMIAYRVPEFGGKSNDKAVMCHVAMHANWVQGFDNPDRSIVQEYVESMHGLDAMLAFARVMGWFIVVTGDGNLSIKEGDTKTYFTMYDVFDKHRLKVWAEHIDVMAYDKRLELVNKEKIGQQRTHSDHKWWLVGDLDRKS